MPKKPLNQKQNSKPMPITEAEKQKLTTFLKERKTIESLEKYLGEEPEDYIYWCVQDLVLKSKETTEIDNYYNYIFFTALEKFEKQLDFTDALMVKDLLDTENIDIILLELLKEPKYMITYFQCLSFGYVKLCKNLELEINSSLAEYGLAISTLIKA